MNQSIINFIRFRHLTHSYPNPLFLRLEWILLFVIILVIPIEPRPQPLLVDLMNVWGIILFGLIGYIIPTQRIIKWLYTFFEFILVFILTTFGLVPLYEFLLIIIVVRNCFLFESKERFYTSILVIIYFIIYHIFKVFNNVLFYLKTPTKLEHIFGPILIFGLVTFFLQMLIEAVIKEYNTSNELALLGLRGLMYN